MKDSPLTGAGFVIFFDNRSLIVKDKPKEILYFVLVDTKDKNDFPKGAIDPYENSLDCAVRETSEESNLILNRDYIQYRKINKIFSRGLSMYIGEHILKWSDLDKDIDLNRSVRILPNDKTGVIEHKSFGWKTYDECYTKFPVYLKEVLDWARLNIE